MTANTSSTTTPPTSTISSYIAGDVVDVTVHPLVLLSAADHYHRVARGTRKRVVGVLLGTVLKGRVDCTNSFAVPFEEDARNPMVVYLDHNYLESMLAMFRKINAKERVVGFYSTGPQIRSNDLRIYTMVKRFVPPGTITPPVFVIIDVRPDRRSIPTTAYKVIEEVDTDLVVGATGGGGEVRKNFAHVPSKIGALEAEEVGVEHLLRDINDPTVSSLANLIKAKISGLATLTDKLVEMKDYLEAAVEGRVKLNQTIVSNMQTILNLLPNLNVEELVKALMIKTNDMYLVVYLSSLIRTVIALHDLVNNKIKFMEGEDHGIDKSKKSNKNIKEGTIVLDGGATTTSEKKKTDKQ
jgi:26S proteasome regulatory subunit N8